MVNVNVPQYVACKGHSPHPQQSRGGALIAAAAGSRRLAELSPELCEAGKATGAHEVRLGGALDMAHVVVASGPLRDLRTRALGCSVRAARAGVVVWIGSRMCHLLVGVRGDRIGFCGAACGRRSLFRRS